MGVAKKTTSTRLPAAVERSRKLQEQFKDPGFMIDEIANYIKDGDILSVTDIISVYISSSPKYKSQAEFAEAIGTNRQTLYRMLINENVGVHIFYRAIERIHQDAQE